MKLKNDVFINDYQRFDDQLSNDKNKKVAKLSGAITGLFITVSLFILLL